MIGHEAQEHLALRVAIFDFSDASYEETATACYRNGAVRGRRAVAQSAGSTEDTEWSKDSVNPRDLTLPLRYEAEFQDGPYKATKSTFELDKAIVPFRLNDEWALITRTKLPLIIEPPKK